MAEGRAWRLPWLVCLHLRDVCLGRRACGFRGCLHSCHASALRLRRCSWGGTRADFADAPAVRHACRSVPGGWSDCLTSGLGLAVRRRSGWAAGSHCGLPDFRTQQDGSHCPARAIFGTPRGVHGRYQPVPRPRRDKSNACVSRRFGHHCMSDSTGRVCLEHRYGIVFSGSNRGTRTEL